MKLNKISPDKELKYWSKELLKGTCIGQASAIIDTESKSNKKLSIKDRVDLLTDEEIILHQLVEALKVSLGAKKNTIELEYKVKNYRELSYDDFREKKLKKYQEEEARLNALSSLLLEPFDQRDRFHADQYAESYQSHLENGIEAALLQNEQAKGVMHLPKHVITFEYGSQGYFVYDSYSKDNGGLFKYPDKESFFDGIRTIARRYMLEMDIEIDKWLISFQVHHH